jgi:phytoene dehydrogenase-like protein
VHDPWVRRLIDLECFLLSGLKAHGTIAPEVAFMLGERSRAGVEYPVGGSGAIVDALVRGLRRWGGELQLNAHVEQILVESGRVVGVRLRKGEILKAPVVISNATIWDTYTKLLRKEDLPQSYRQSALETPAVDSFMHLHLGIRAEGLEQLTGHHVVVHDADKDITEPGNTCMISIPQCGMLISLHRVIMSFMPIPWNPTRDGDEMRGYEEKKKERSQPLFHA